MMLILQATEYRSNQFYVTKKTRILTQLENEQIRKRSDSWLQIIKEMFSNTSNEMKEGSIQKANTGIN